MTYDFSNSSKQIPNPLKVENIFFGLCSTLYIAAGLALLLVTRAHLAEAGRSAKFLAIILALALLVVGGGYLARALTQLRFFFGRGRPTSLASDVPQNQQGTSAPAKHISDTLLHQALPLTEPSGPVQGLLYTLVPNLIYAPAILQRLASVQFRNLLNMTIIFVSMLLVLLFGSIGGGTSGGKIVDWIGLVYLVYALKILLWRSSSVNIGEGHDVLSVGKLVLLFGFSIVGPALLAVFGDALPGVGGLSPFPHVFIVMIFGIVAFGLFFLALVRQVRSAPNTTVACSTETWSINCHPSQVMTEFDRVMQHAWVDQMPNRRYIRHEPAIDLNEKTGSFQADLLEETQPTPAERDAPTLGSAMAEPRHVFILSLDALGLASHAIAAVCGFMLGLRMQDALSFETLHGWLFYTLAFAAIGHYALSAAHALWNRFDFKSRLYWMEMRGQYVSATMNYGNIINDSIRTNSSVVQIESMTFRLWVADVVTVAFGKDSARSIVGMLAVPQAAEHLTAQLRKFAESQSIILAPTADADMQRHAQLAKLNQPAESRPVQPGVQRIAAGMIAANESTTNCPRCAAPIEPTDVFCGACGAPLRT
jgi:hypothetical protein